MEDIEFVEEEQDVSGYMDSPASSDSAPSSPPLPLPTPTSSRISIPPTSDEVRNCIGCKQNFPKNANYFAINKAGNCSRSCHECVYQAKVAKGKTPEFPAKNGVNQKEYYAQLKSSSPPKASAKKTTASAVEAPASNSPWLKPRKQETAPAPAPAPSSSHDTSSRVREFILDPQLSRDKNGGLTLTINDYFKLGKMRTVTRDAPTVTPQPSSSSSIPSIREQLKPTRALPPPPPEEQPQEEDDAVYIDPRAELLKDVVTYPHTAAKLDLTLERVQRMSDEDCGYWYDTFSAINVVMKQGQIVHYGLTMVAGVAEGFVKDIPVSDNFHADLAGFSQEIADDPNIASCINELCRENEEVIEEYVEPEYRLGLLLLGKAHQVMMRNNKRRLEDKEKSEYLRNGKYGFPTSSSQAPPQQGGQ